MKKFALYGVIALPDSFATHLLYIFLANAAWYIGFYISMKKTPAESREGNRDCLLFDFYDDHDVWHMLSACGLFFTFMILLTLDDDIDDRKPRDEIPVF
ncbi:SID1 transmembrane family member 1-like [Ptychodera flava]|uniref:SID1 transmembrane family member 1-like n=1 Tax=Ptychodera flava TaxID=63121 RepID=UPI00396A9200